MKNEATQQRRMMQMVVMMIHAVQIKGQVMVRRHSDAHIRMMRHNAMMQIRWTVRRLFRTGIGLAVVAASSAGIIVNTGLEIAGGGGRGGAGRDTIVAGRKCGWWRSVEMMIVGRRRNDVDVIIDWLIVGRDSWTASIGGNMEERLELAKIEGFVVDAANKIRVTFFLVMCVRVYIYVT